MLIALPTSNTETVAGRSSPIPLQNSTDHKKTTDRGNLSVVFLGECKSALHHVHAAHSTHTAHAIH